MALHTSDITALLRRIEEVRPGFDSDRVMRAFTLTRDLYKGEPHWTGMSVTEHVMGVLDLLLPFEPDEDAIAASILHHAFQTGHGISLVEIEEQFGPAVRSMISGVHLLSNVTMQSRRHSIDDLRLMLISVSDDIRVILITLCDRCHVLDQLQDKSHAEEAKRIANDVLHLFAPVAARLGIYRLKHMLEQRAFPISYPSEAEKITEQLAAVEAKKGHFLERATALLRKQLVRQGIEVEAECREKEPYSIFRKMRSKSLSHVEDVQDLFAVRLITNAADECYRVLGFLHTMGRPVANRFKDYIAFPKPNGYQSLHSTLSQLPGVPQDTFVEVQIRSAQMHREAKYGIAAHWSYKEFGATRRAVEQAQLHAMLSSQEPVGGPVGGQSLADNIFVLTPKGDVVELPEGATPLDFAFQVHTDLGLSFRAAKVNGAVVPLDHELENGDVVEVQKYATPRPSPQWLQLVKMASSRSKLKRHLYAQRREELVAHGRELVNAELEKHRLPPLDSDLSVLRICDGEVLPFARREDLLMKIGQEAEKASALLGRLGAFANCDFVHEQRPRRTKRPRGRISRLHSDVEIEGGLSMPVRYAKCCKPFDAPREKIVGVVSRAGQVVLHREKCAFLKNANPERKVWAKWQTTA